MADPGCFTKNLPLDEEKPSERSRAFNMSLAQSSYHERLKWLSTKLEALGADDLAALAAQWSREHAGVAAQLMKRAR